MRRQSQIIMGGFAASAAVSASAAKFVTSQPVEGVAWALMAAAVVMHLWVTR